MAINLNVTRTDLSEYDATLLLGFKGDTGQTAYEYAVDHGYEGTENDFGILMASYATVAEAAAASASSAAQSALESSDSADASEFFADAASTSASNASASESNASSSATSAASSANTASTEATNAAISASNSAQSATDSATSASNSAQSATDSATSASNSATSAASALVQATAAAASATEAASSASDASDDADRAEAAMEAVLGMSATATTLSAGSDATASYDEGVLTLGIPRGDTGATPQFSIGTVSTLDPDDPATATITGTAEAPILSLGIPKGDTGEVSQADLDEAVTDLKAEISENGVVAGANGLVSDSKISDAVPYLFRQTADGQRVGNVLYEEIVGGTVAWNQLVQNGNFADSSVWTKASEWSIANNKASFSASTSGNTFFNLYQQISVVSGHKYLFGITVSDYSTTGVYQNRFAFDPTFGNYPTAIADITGNGRYEKIKSASSTGNYYIGIKIQKGASQSLAENISNIVAIDLTQMFGTTIADHLYALEQATAGAGVAVFRKMFPNSYYAYNAGELMSVKALRHITRGFNAWDEEWANGNFDANGDIVANNNTFYSKNYIRVVSNATYFFKSIGQYRLCYYDSDKGFIERSALKAGNSVFTIPSNCEYIRFHTDGTAYNPSVNPTCINLHWDGERDGDYEEYVEHVYELDPDLELRGIPKLTAGNDLYYDGDVYEPDGTVTRKYGIVDLGTLNWNVSTSNPSQHNSEIVNIKKNTDNIVSAKYLNDPSNRASASSMTDGHMVVNARTIYITSGNGVNPSGYLVYELATPTTETAEPYTSPQIVDRYGTEEYVTTGIVPVGHNSKYSEDLKGKIESLPWDFSTLIAPTETAYKATRNYTTGGLLIVNNILYKVTANIANGGTITPNTNVVATTLAEIIANL